MQNNFTDLSHPHENQFLSPKLTLFFAIAIMMFAFVGIVGIQIFKQRTDALVTSYETCVNAKGSTLLTSYPGICVSASGKRFVQPLTDDEQRKLVPPTQPTATPESNPVSFTLPFGWKEIKPDSSTEATDQGIKTLEFAKIFETRPYPIGRITLQYTQEIDRLRPPESVFDPEKESLGELTYTVVTGDENGGLTGNYQYRVYHGTTADQKYTVRIFLRFQSESEKEEQKKIAATFSFVSKDIQATESGVIQN